MLDDDTVKSQYDSMVHLLEQLGYKNYEFSNFAKEGYYSVNNSNYWNGPYLDAVPNDPWKTPYLYGNPGSKGKDIDVYTYGADGVSGGEGSNKDWGNWNVQ